MSRHAPQPDLCPIFLDGGDRPLPLLFPPLDLGKGYPLVQGLPFVGPGSWANTLACCDEVTWVFPCSRGQFLRHIQQWRPLPGCSSCYCECYLGVLTNVIADTALGLDFGRRFGLIWLSVG